MEDKKIEKYGLSKLIGLGGFAEVFLCHNGKLKRYEACKIQKKEPKLGMKLLRYEAAILNHLKGVKGIPELYRYDEDSHYELLKMELLGENLESILKRGQLVSTKVKYKQRLL